MQTTISLKLASLFCLIFGIIIHGFTFDRGILAYIGPVLFLIGIFVSFGVIKEAHSLNKAIIAVALWTLAILFNRITGSYEFYSKYDFIDPLSGFLLSAILALLALSSTIYFYFKRHR